MRYNYKDIELYYRIQGEGRPIIMLHGFGPDHRLLSGCIEPLLEKSLDWKRIYLDLPGMGKSSSKKWLDNSDKMLDVILSFIDNVIPGENFSIISQSYGSYLARAVLKKRFDLVDGLMLLCPVIYAEKEKRSLPENKEKITDEFLISLTKSEQELFKSVSFQRNEEIWTRTKEEVLSGCEISNMIFMTRLQNTGYHFSFDPDELKNQFDRPTLILAGKQDTMVGWKDAFNILDNYSQATFCVINNAGHNLQIEQVNIFNIHVQKWLSEL